jgi:hypothetical protein
MQMLLGLLLGTTMLLETHQATSYQSENEEAMAARSYVGRGWAYLHVQYDL